MSATLAPPDYAAARDRMVDGQVRPNKVTDPRIIQAMRQLPRERFVPAGLAALAYVDEDVPLPGGRALMEPMVIARLVQLLRVRPGERVLVVGSGSGYGAALLAACGVHVTALEQDPALIALARSVLPAVAPGVVLADGPLTAGWPTGGPYDAILIEGSVPEIPDALAAQLTAEGRVAAAIARPTGRAGVRVPGQGVLAEAVLVGGVRHLRAQPAFDCNTPALPAFVPSPSFSF